MQVLPKTGQLSVQVKTMPPVAMPPVAMPPERSNLEVSSGAGELSDSLSFGELGVSHIHRKKVRV